MIHKVDDRSWVTAFYDSAAEWWGNSWYGAENLKPRLERIQRFAGSPPKSLLELGAGAGETAAFLAANGYQVTAVDLSDKNYDLLFRIQKKYPGFKVVQGDFYSVSVPEKFDAVCMFETFGMGTDKEQRTLLKRVSSEWLCPGGVMIMDVYHPFGPIKKAGTFQSHERLADVPGSVDMTESCFYDTVLGRWIDAWEPVGMAEQTRVQSVRCYTPADLLLLLEGTGLKLLQAEFRGQAFDPKPARVSTISPLHLYENHYAYHVVLGAV